MNSYEYSAHAVLRYLERKLGINLDEIRAEILNEQILAQIEQFGSGKFPLDGGLKAVVKQNVVVSVIER